VFGLGVAIPKALSSAKARGLHSPEVAILRERFGPWSQQNAVLSLCQKAGSDGLISCIVSSSSALFLESALPMLFSPVSLNSSRLTAACI